MSDRVCVLVFSGHKIEVPVASESEADVEQRLDRLMAGSLGSGMAGVASVGNFRFSTRFWVGWYFCDAKAGIQQELLEELRKQRAVIEGANGAEDWQSDGEED